MSGKYNNLATFCNEELRECRSNHSGTTGDANSYHI